MLESDDPALRMALCGRFSAGITLLKSTLNDPVLHYLAESLTADILPLSPLVLIPILNCSAITVLSWRSFDRRVAVAGKGEDAHSYLASSHKHLHDDRQNDIDHAAVILFYLINKPVTI